MTDEQLQEMRWSIREPPKASRIALFEDEFSRRANILLDESILTREQADSNTRAIENLVQVTAESRRAEDVRSPPPLPSAIATMTKIHLLTITPMGTLLRRLKRQVGRSDHILFSIVTCLTVGHVTKHALEFSENSGYNFCKLDRALSGCPTVMEGMPCKRMQQSNKSELIIYMREHPMRKIFNSIHHDPAGRTQQGFFQVFNFFNK